MSKLLIVGLGNYPKQYDNTRHNVGFATIDKLANQLNVKLTNSKFNGLYGSLNVGENTIYIAKPYTLMNLSGEFIQPLMNFYKIDIDNLLVICDDVDTPFGSLKLRKKGSSGGQNGLKSIIKCLGSEDFKRIKIGIGRPIPPISMVDHVLSKFNRNQLEILDKVTDKAINAINNYINGANFEQLMSKYNSI